MTDPKAPLPVEVTLVDSRFAIDTALAVMIYRAEWNTIRAYITAQAEKIAELEENLSQSANWQGIQQLEEAMQSQGDLVSSLDNKLAALEAREQRLREAADIALGHMTGGLDGNWADCDPVEKLRAALARTGGE